MNYPVNTSSQLRAVLHALRQSCNFSQTEVGQLLGVNQKRIARIENVPGVTSFEQISQLVAALGGRLVIETTGNSAAATVATTNKGCKRKTKIPPGRLVRSFMPQSSRLAVWMQVCVSAPGPRAAEPMCCNMIFRGWNRPPAVHFHSRFLSHRPILPIMVRL